MNQMTCPQVKFNLIIESESFVRLVIVVIVFQFNPGVLNSDKDLKLKVTYKGENQCLFYLTLSLV